MDKKKATRITIDEIVRFAFPPHLEHSQSTGRLFLLAEYGPLSTEHSYATCLCNGCKAKATAQRHKDPMLFKFVHNKVHISAEDAASSLYSFLCEKCRFHCDNVLHITGGFRGADVLAPSVIRGMADECVRQDILQAYDRKVGLTRQEESHFLQLVREQRGDDIHPLWSKQVVIELFEPLFNKHQDENKTVDFYLVRRFIQKKRADLVKSLRKMYQNVVKEKPLPVTYKASQLGTYLRKNNRKVTPAESYILTSRLLHKYAQHLSKEDLNRSAAVTVYFLRDLQPDSETHWKSH